MLVFVFGSDIHPRQDVIIDTTADSEYVVGKICDGSDFRISEHRRVVENPSPYITFAYGANRP